MKKILKKNIVDILVSISLIILILTTLKINIYIGLYLLSLVLLGIAIIISRYRDEHNWSFKKWILIRDEKIGKLGLLVIKWPKKGQTIPMRIIKCKILGC